MYIDAIEKTAEIRKYGLKIYERLMLMRIQIYYLQFREQVSRYVGYMSHRNPRCCSQIREHGELISLSKRNRFSSAPAADGCRG